jgi:fucose permease
VFEPAARPPRETELWTVLAFAFGLLLFFQFTAEWSIAGWLPIILIDRLGISPRSAVDLLALYWFALGAGRLGASWLISHVRQGFLLAGSAFSALFGCAAILAAGNRFGIVTGMLLAGMGFSAIYPLASAKISTRFSSYHPGYFNGMFTFALLGGMLMPFVLGHVAADFGLGIVPLAAMIASCAVLLLLMLIWLGRRVSGN